VKDVCLFVFHKLGKLLAEQSTQFQIHHADTMPCKLMRYTNEYTKIKCTNSIYAHSNILFVKSGINDALANHNKNIH